MQLLIEECLFSSFPCILGHLSKFLRIAQSWMVFAELYIIIFQNETMQNQNRIWKEPTVFISGIWREEWYVECYVLMSFHIMLL